MKDFNEAAERLRDRVNDGQSVTSDAENLLRRASAIDSLMTRFAFETRPSATGRPCGST